MCSINWEEERKIIQSNNNLTPLELRCRMELLDYTKSLYSTETNIPAIITLLNKENLPFHIIKTGSKNYYYNEEVKLLPKLENVGTIMITTVISSLLLLIYVYRRYGK